MKGTSDTKWTNETINSSYAGNYASEDVDMYHNSDATRLMGGVIMSTSSSAERWYACI